MTIPQYMVLTSTLLAVAFVCNLYRKLATERAKRIEAIQKLMGAKAELEEWHTTACIKEHARAFNAAMVAKAKREITTLHCQLDSMTNGDRRCPNNHRFYSGEGVTCPRCNALEVVTWTYPAWKGRLVVSDEEIARRESAIWEESFPAFEGIKVEDLSAEWKVCGGCGKPVQSNMYPYDWHPACHVKAVSEIPF